MRDDISLKKQAVALEKVGKIFEAIDKYEEFIQSGQGDLESYLNLSFLYFFIIDPGYAFKFHLSNEFVEQS